MEDNLSYFQKRHPSNKSKRKQESEKDIKHQIRSHAN